MRRYLIISIILVFLSSAGAALYFYREKGAPAQKTEELSAPAEQKDEDAQVQEKIITEPIEGAKSRVTKKPFGIYITPATSPVQSEKFSGFHTGTDFEVTNDEQGKEISIFAISDGAILEVREVSGYGGVIVQSASINSEDVTVLYGHVLISENFSPKRGDKITAGQKISILAPDKSRYSGGERKHLHLGIHKGTNIVYAGYVNSEKGLSAWLNVEDFL